MLKNNPQVGFLPLNYTKIKGILTLNIKNVLYLNSFLDFLVSGDLVFGLT